MKILVTGHNGFIGKRLMQRLYETNFQVIPYQGNILDIVDFNEKCDGVIHLAANVITSSSKPEDPYDFFKVNILGTHCVCEYARKKSAFVIFTSSSAVYSNSSILDKVSENSSTKPKSLNGIVKLMCENIVSLASKQGNFYSVILRIFNVYGPGQKEPYLIPYLVKSLLNRTNIQIRNKNAERDFIYVDDIAEAIIAAVEWIKLKQQSTIFNIGTGLGSSVGFVLEELAKLIPINTDINFTQLDEQEVTSMIANISYTSSQLNWQPKISLQDGLRKTLEYFKTCIS